MAKAYRMTAARRVVLRKAQLASARKRRGRGRSVLSRNAKIGIAATIGTTAVIGSAVTARKVYNNQFVTLYHNTSPRNAEKIMKTGFSEKASQSEEGRVFFQFGGPKAQKYAYGSAVVKMRVPKSHVTKRVTDKRYRVHSNFIQPDWNEFELSGMKAVSIHARTIKRAGYKIKLGKQQGHRNMIQKARQKVRRRYGV